MAKKILVVLTSQSTIEPSGTPTGWYLPELAHPYDILSPHYEIVLASPKGGHAPLDPSSVSAFAADPSSAAFLRTHASLWENTHKLSSFLGRAHEFAAIFYPGGHGPMFDLRVDRDSIRLIAEFFEAGKPVAAVCHGPIVFANVEVGGHPLVRGRRVTGFSNAEEEAAGKAKEMPVLLETELKDKGGVFEKADELFGEKVVVDGLLISGQNPASSKGVGEEILKALQG